MFRNQEIKRQAVLFGMFWMIGLAGMIAAPDFAVLIWCLLGMCTAGLWYLESTARYRSVNRLVRELDEILHGNTVLEISSFQEGDMEVLRDEIYKMTVRLREQAEQSLKGKKELADSLADISHQIKTPLTTLNLLTERMKNPNLNEEEQRKLLREMKQMLERIERLITVLLKLSRLDAGAVELNVQEVPLYTLVKKALAPLEIAIELRGQKLTLQGEKDTMVLADETWTVEAIGNLLKNSMEYTPNEGEIFVSWQDNPLYTSLEISDGGLGFEKEDLPHLFERFYKGKNSKGSGFGIGLALAKAIFFRENAKVKADNQKHGGGMFTVRFYKGNL